MYIRVDHPTGPEHQPVPATVPEVDDAVVARDLTAEETDGIVARFEAEAATARRRTWRRRTSIRTSVFRRAGRQPKSGRS